MQPCSDTIQQFFYDFAAERPNDRFLFDEEESFSVREAYEVALSLAAQCAAAGVGEGTLVALSASRTVRTILSFFALQLLGAQTVLFDPRDSACGFDLTVKAGVLSAGGRQTPLRFAPGSRPAKLAEDSRAPTIVIFTSGSTGEPKTVRLSQYNFINNSLDTLDIGGYWPDDVNIDVVPIHHVFGLALIFTAVVARHSIFVPRSVASDDVVRAIIRHRATRLNGVPSLYLAMAGSPLAAQVTSLRCGLIGGAPCTQEQFAYIERRLGITLIPVYGMSECVGISCGSFRDGAEARRTSVGRVYSMNTVRIAEDGEILVRSPAMAQGAAGEDGFLHTGDLGYIDEGGYLRVSGRKKDIIIRNGNNLSALAIEQKLLQMPQVLDACVVGVNDEKEGEVPAAAVVLRAGCRAEDLPFAENMIKLEMPKYWKAFAAIPLTATGKPDKQAVRALFAGDGR